MVCSTNQKCGEKMMTALKNPSTDKPCLTVENRSIMVQSFGDLCNAGTTLPR